MSVSAIQCPSCHEVHLCPPKRGHCTIICPHCSHGGAFETFGQAEAAPLQRVRTILPGPRKPGLAPPELDLEKASPLSMEPRKLPSSLVSFDWKAAVAEEEAVTTLAPPQQPYYYQHPATVQTVEPAPPLAAPLPQLSTPLPQVSAPLPQVAAPLPQVSAPLPAAAMPNQAPSCGEHAEIPDADEQASLLSFFDDTEEDDVPAYEDESAVFPEPVYPEPIAPRTINRLADRISPEEVEARNLNKLEDSWVRGKRSNKSDRVFLGAALYIACALFVGAFVFIQLEDSVASGRQEQERHEAFLTESQTQAESRDLDLAMLAAEEALTQPDWTGLLSYVKDGRSLASTIRDHYDRWPYAAYSDPDFTFIKRVADGPSVFIHFRVDAGKPWSRRVIMEKVDGQFKLDWEAYQLGQSDRFKSEAGELINDPFLDFRLDQHEQYANQYFYELTDPISLK